MTDSFRRPETVEHAVLAALRNMILTRQLQPGDPIRQDAIAEQLGVSKLPVREALKILDGEGQVTNRPHRGYVVAELKLEELLEIYRMRELLEEDVIQRTRTPPPRETLRQMEEAMKRIESAGDDLSKAIEANRRFHFSLLESNGRPQTVRIIRLLWDSSEPYRVLYYMRPDSLARVCEEHQRIYDAVASGRIDDLIAELRNHRNAAVAALKDVLTPAPSET